MGGDGRLCCFSGLGARSCRIDLVGRPTTTTPIWISRETAFTEWRGPHTQFPLAPAT